MYSARFPVLCGCVLCFSLFARKLLDPRQFGRWTRKRWPRPSGRWRPRRGGDHRKEWSLGAPGWWSSKLSTFIGEASNPILPGLPFFSGNQEPRGNSWFLRRTMVEIEKNGDLTPRGCDVCGSKGTPKEYHASWGLPTFNQAHSAAHEVILECDMFLKHKGGGC